MTSKSRHCSAAPGYSQPPAARQIPLWEAYCRERIKREAGFVGSRLRCIEGVATSDGVTEKGYRLFPLGASYSLPIPLLLGHEKRQPLGWVTEIDMQYTQLRFKAQIANHGLPRVDEVWNDILFRRKRAVSVLAHYGPGDEGYDPADGIWTVRKWEFQELSVCETTGSSWDALIDFVADGNTVYWDGRPPQEHRVVKLMK